MDHTITLASSRLRHLSAVPERDGTLWVTQVFREPSPSDVLPV